MFGQKMAHGTTAQLTLYIKRQVVHTYIMQLFERGIPGDVYPYVEVVSSSCKSAISISSRLISSFSLRIILATS